LHQPKIVNGPHQALQFTHVRRFHQVGIGARPIRLGDVPLLAGGTEDDHNARKFWLLTNPFQDVQPHHEWQFQIEQNKTRQWKFLPLGEFANALQIVDGLLAIVSDLAACDKARRRRRIKGKILDSFDEKLTNVCNNNPSS
jgi:hypothetical protein